MKVKVIRSFTDKNTLKSVEEGAIIEVTKERFGELTSTARGIFVEEAKKEKPTKKEGE